MQQPVVFQANAVDLMGNVLSGATITVTNVDSALPVVLFSDLNDTPLSNPFNAGTNGEVIFYCEGQVVNITAEKDGFVTTWLNHFTSTQGVVDLFSGSNKSYATTEQLTDYTMTPNRHIFGEEYLWGFQKQVFDSGNSNVNKFVWSGDSTTAGDNTGGYTPDFIGSIVSTDLGLAKHTHINAGHSGDSSVQWASIYVDQDIASHSDMNVYIPRWGINDGSVHGDLATYISSMETGLSKLRAFKDVSALTIVVVSPNSTYDPFLGRDENWYESIIPELRKLCRKHQAVFIDIYSIWQDAKQGGGKWYDQPNTGGGPAPIHPDAVLALQIGSRITKMIVEPIMFGQNFAINKLQSTDPDQFNPSASVIPSLYARGISLWTVSVSDGWLVSGKLRVTRNGTKVIQELYPTEAEGVQVSEQGTQKYTRYGDATAAVWSKWYNAGVGPVILNGWSVVSGRTVKYVHTDTGLCTLMGTIGSGSDGSTLFTLPVEMRPSSPRTFPTATDIGTGSVVVNSDGNVQPYMNGGTFINLDGVCWSAIN